MSVRRSGLLKPAASVLLSGSPPPRGLVGGPRRAAGIGARFSTPSSHRSGRGLQSQSAQNRSLPHPHVQHPASRRARERACSARRFRPAPRLRRQRDTGRHARSGLPSRKGRSDSTEDDGQGRCRTTARARSLTSYEAFQRPGILLPHPQASQTTGVTRRDPEASADSSNLLDSAVAGRPSSRAGPLVHRKAPLLGPKRYSGLDFGRGPSCQEGRSAHDSNEQKTCSNEGTPVTGLEAKFQMAKRDYEAL